MRVAFHKRVSLGPTKFQASKCNRRAQLSCSCLAPRSLTEPASMDNAVGCLVGVAVGDAAGAPLELNKGVIQPEEASKAMRMPGSKYLPVLGKGQTTDDTELTICLARGLVGHPPSRGFPVESVAKQYSFWHAAGAFAGGNTCQTAFSVPLESDRAKWGDSGSQPSLATRMRARSHRMSMESQANGALMRVAPLAIWGHQLSPALLAEYAAADASLSHPNPTCGDCSAAYCLEVAHLIARPGDAEGALKSAEAWAQEHAGKEVQQWLLKDSHQPPDQLDCTASAGFLKHGFTLAFCHLRRRSPFEDGILQTLCRGGDTDTNAAIVGGMLGALHGAAAIPAWMSQPVLEYEGREDQGGGTPRPRELRASCLPDLAQQLFQLAGQ